VAAGGEEVGSEAQRLRKIDLECVLNVTEQGGRVLGVQVGSQEVQSDEPAAPRDLQGQLVGQVAGRGRDRPEVGVAGDDRDVEAVAVDVAQDVVGESIAGVGQVDGHATFVQTVEENASVVLEADRRCVAPAETVLSVVGDGEVENGPDALLELIQPFEAEVQGFPFLAQARCILDRGDDSDALARQVLPGLRRVAERAELAVVIAQETEKADHLARREPCASRGDVRVDRKNLEAHLSLVQAGNRAADVSAPGCIGMPHPSKVGEKIAVKVGD